MADYLQLCRVCMRQDSAKKPLHLRNVHSRLPSFITDISTFVELLEITVPGTLIADFYHLPLQICKSCRAQLVEAYEFNQLCKAVDEIRKSTIRERPVIIHPAMPTMPECEGYMLPVAAVSVSQGHNSHVNCYTDREDNVGVINAATDNELEMPPDMIEIGPKKVHEYNVVDSNVMTRITVHPHECNQQSPVCTACKVEFSKKNSLVGTNEAAIKLAYPYKCKLCDVKYEKLVELQAHKVLEHAIIPKLK